MENKKSKKDIVKMLVAQDLTGKDEEDLMELLIDEQIAVNVEKEEESKMTRGDKVADSWILDIHYWILAIFIILDYLKWSNNEKGC